MRTEFPSTERTLPAILDAQATTYGDRPFLTIGDTTRTFVEMRDAAARLADAFAASGTRPGDRIAIMAENRLEIIDAWFACAWLGAILVPINTATKGPQLEHVLSNSEPRALAIEPAFLERLELLDQVPSGLEQLWLLDHDRLEPWRGLPVQPFPAPGNPIAPRTRSCWRDRHDPLHLRHDRTLEGSDVPPGAVLLVGAFDRRSCSTESATTTCSTPACRSFTPTH